MVPKEQVDFFLMRQMNEWERVQSFIVCFHLHIISTNSIVAKILAMAPTE